MTGVSAEIEPAAPAPVVGDQRLLLWLPLVAFLAPLLHAGLSLKVPLSSNALMLAGFTILLAAALGLALHWVENRGRGTVPQLVRAALLSMTLILVFDLLFYPADSPILLMLVFPTLGVWAVLTGIFWVIRRQVAKILFIGAVALVASTLAPHIVARLPHWGEAPTLPGARVAAGPVIYIVLDEMIGPEAIPREIEGGERAYGALRALFERHGFRLYGRTFSRHSLTFRSVPNTLNFDLDDQGRGMILQHASNNVVEATLFRQMAARRPLAIYQTKHLNFCSAVASHCETLPSYDAQSPWVADQGFGPAEDLEILRIAFSGSLAAQAGISLIGAARGLQVSGTVPEYFDVHAFPAWFDHVAAAIGTSDGTWNHFVHLLSPHSPYILDESCVAGDGWDLPYNLTETHGLTGDALDARRAAQYRGYFRQMGCLIHKLDGMFTQIDSNPALADATIVLHGDHGSRISAGRMSDTVSERDLIDNHAALYAIRGRDIAPGYDLRQVSIQALTAEYFGAKPYGPGEADDLDLVIDASSGDGTVIVPMPQLPMAPATGLLDVPLAPPPQLPH